MSTQYEYIVFPDGSFRRISSDELMHFKYIKRERKNGRWVYYYDQSELDQAERDARKVERKITRAKAERDLTRIDPWSTHNQVVSAEKKLQTAQKKGKSVIRKYEAMKIVSFPARVVSTAVVVVANLFSKLFSIKKKKK